MSVTGYINVSLELFGCVLSLILSVCLLVNASTDLRSRLFLQLVVCNAVILLCDAAAWLFKGYTDVVSWWGVRISNLAACALGFVLLALFTHYLTDYLGERTRVSPLPLRLIRVLCVVSFLLVVLSQFNHMFYYFDQQNVYHRGSWFWLSQVGGIAGMCVNAGLMLRYRRAIDPQDRAALWTYILLPVLAMAVQIFVYGLALLNLATTFSLLVIFLFLQVEQARRAKEQELELAQSRISVMLSQIQPHFLYNALTAIKDLCATNPGAAERAVDRFASFLRGNMDSLTSRAPVPFAQELSHTLDYLELEKLRFGGRLRVVTQTPVTGFLIPALTLQPLVENAVRWGVTKRREGGCVTIRTGQDPERWTVTVLDDGVGFDPARPPVPDGRSHVGIQNVRSRLASQCGGSLAIESVPGQGTKAVIAIPKEGVRT